MKNLTKSISALLMTAGVLLTQIAFSQSTRPHKTPEERAKAQTEWMTSELKLTEEQVPKVDQINLKYAQKMEPVLNGTGRKLSKLQQMKAISNEKEVELKKVFTKEQFQLFEQRKEEMQKLAREQFKQQRR